MKKLMFCLLSLQSFFLSAQDKFPGQLWTVKEVQEVGKKYEFQDEISTTKNNMLLFMPQRDIEKYFAKERETMLTKKEFALFRDKTKYVRTYEDYSNLVETYPRVRKLLVKSFGNEEGYQKEKNAHIKTKYRIYREDNGALKFVKAENEVSDSEHKMGQRIDNLPKM